MKQLQKRNDLAELLTEMGLAGNAAFIGCAEAQFEMYFLDRWRGSAYLVDPWAILNEPGFSGHGAATDFEQEIRYQRVKRASKRYNGRAIPMRATSEEAAKAFKDGFFDFVFLDGNHIYEQVVKDLAWWFVKVKSGGVFSGHDHLDGLVGGVDYGVKRAVSEFAQAHGLTVNATEEPDYPSWWVVKPPSNVFIHGPNARINIGSIDRSINIA